MLVFSFTLKNIMKVIRDGSLLLYIHIMLIDLLAPRN